MQKQTKQFINEIDCVKKHSELTNSMQLMEQEQKNQGLKIDKIIKKLDDLPKTFVTKKEFEPVKAVVYGMVGFILLSFLAGVAALVIKLT